MGGVQQGVRVVTMKNGRTKRFRSKLERRQIVEETLKPAASVSVVARARDVNANQVFKWRKEYREGRLDVEPTTSALLPVRIRESLPMVRLPLSRRRKARRVGIIDIDLGHARVRIDGGADPDCVRAALEGLIR